MTGEGLFNMPFAPNPAGKQKGKTLQQKVGVFNDFSFSEIHGPVKEADS